MSGPGEGKIKLKKVDVYLHLKGKSGATVTHLDIESPEIDKILENGKTFCSGKKGGCFIALRSDMIKRAEKIAKK
mgnify:CR=1 FL=1